MLFFLTLGVVTLALGHRVAAAVCLPGLLSGIASVGIARRRGQDMAHTFAVADWLLLGCVLALTGGTGSWLLPAVPLLAMGQLCVAPRADWPYLLGPALLLVIVLAIADPSLGGNRVAGVFELAVLVGGGVVAASRLRRAPARPHVSPKVDQVTGLYTASRLNDILAVRTAAALEAHEPLSVVYLRLEHFQDARNFLGPQGSDELLRGVSRRLQRHLGAEGVAFRVRPDAFVAVLPGQALAAARELAAAVSHDVGSNLISGRRQTLACGAASFPTVRDLRALLASAAAEAAPAESRQAAPRAVPLAAAQ
jgi:diguanylate cyclase (GGDEF)-like protein